VSIAVGLMPSHIDRVVRNELGIGFAFRVEVVGG